MKYIILKALFVISSSLYPSTPSRSDDACAAAASHSNGQDPFSGLPAELLICNTIPCLSPKEIKQFMISSKRMDALKADIITECTKYIIWPEDMNDEHRRYCVEKMIDLELPEFYILTYGSSVYAGDGNNCMIPVVVEKAMRGDLDLRDILPGRYNFSRNTPDEMFALAIMLDKDKTIKIDNSTSFKDSPIHRAAADGTAPLIRMLSKLGANVHAITTYKHITPLHAAAETKNLDTMQELIRLGAGASVNLQNSEGLSALMLVFYKFSFCADDAKTYLKKTLNMITLLLKNGANPYALTPCGKNALELAQECQGKNPCVFMETIISHLEEFMAANPREVYE